MLEIGQRAGWVPWARSSTYPDGRLQHAGIVLLPSGPTHVHIAKPGNYPGYFGSTLTPRNYSAVTAAAMLTPTEAFDELGGFDTTFARDFNDVDYCLRLRAAGYRVAWTPYAHLTHHEGASIVRKAADPAELAAFRERWAVQYALGSVLLTGVESAPRANLRSAMKPLTTPKGRTFIVARRRQRDHHGSAPDHQRSIRLRSRASPACRWWRTPSQGRSSCAPPHRLAARWWSPPT